MSPINTAIIIGGGPAGLAAAIRLKKHNGIDTSIYEIRSEPATVGGAISIPPNGLRLFDRLGLFNQLASRGNSASQFILHSMQSSTLLNIDRALAVKEKVGFGFMRILRSDVMDVLLLAAQENSVPIHYGKRLRQLLENNDGVSVTFSDGTTETADLLLGCDGIHSAVRKLHVCPTAVPEYSGISNMFAILPKPQLPERVQSISPAFHGTLTPEGLLGITPCTASHDQLYWFYSHEVAMPNNDDDRDGWTSFGANEVKNFTSNVLRVIKDATGEWADMLRGIITSTETIKFYPIYKMPSVCTWSTKRCLILGDAAHAMQPHVGQGASMALEDVFLLSKLLQDESSPLSKVFEQYEASRRPRVEGIARASANSGETRMNTSLFKLKLKEAVIGAGFWLYSAAGLQRWGVGMSQKDFTYDVMDEASWIEEN